jgi:hypothetical protein
MRSEREDEDLLAALRAAAKARAEVPPEHVTAVKDVYAWHTVDAELARLTFDSSRMLSRPPGPSPPPSAR